MLRPLATQMLRTRLSTPFHKYGNVCRWGLRGEIKAGGRRRRLDIFDDDQHRDRPQPPSARRVATGRADFFVSPPPLWQGMAFVGDSMTCLFWSVSENRHVSYFRHPHGGRRAVARTTYSDFVEWTPEVAMRYSDTGTSTPSQHLYTNQTQPYFRAPHIYIALPARYFPGKRVLTGQGAGSAPYVVGKLVT